MVCADREYRERERKCNSKEKEIRPFLVLSQEKAWRAFERMRSTLETVKQRQKDFVCVCVRVCVCACVVCVCVRGWLC